MNRTLCLIVFAIMLSGVMPVFTQAALASSLDLAGKVERTIDLPHGGVERMVWSDDGASIAVLLSHGAYIADARDGHTILQIWGGGDDDEGRLGSGSILAFTPGGKDLIAPVYTGGKQENVWDQGVESNGAYLFTAVDVSSGSAQYVFSAPDIFPGHIRRYSTVGGDVARDESSLIVALDPSGYFGVYSGDKPSQLTRYLGPILNKGHNAFGAPKIFYDDMRTTLTLVYIDGEIKVWDTAHNKPGISFSPSATGFSAAALDRSTGNLCTGGNGLIAGGRDDPATMVRCWNLKTGTLIRAFLGTTSGINSITVSPDGRFIAAIEGGEAFPLRLLLWSKDTAEPLSVIDYGRKSSRSAVSFSPDGGILAAAVGNRIQLISVPR